MDPRFRRVRRWARAGLAISVWLAPLAVAHAQNEEREAPEVRQVSFSGVHAVDKGELAQSIATAASTCRSIILKPFCLVSHSSLWWQKEYLDETEFKRDLLRIQVFYFKHGYRETQVDSSVSRYKNGVAVHFTIQEGPPTLVSVIRVTQTDSVLPNGPIANAMVLRAGRPLDLFALDSSLQNLKEAFWAVGYADAEVTDTVAVADSANRARVEIRVNPSWLTRVAEIRITGNQKVETATIRKSLSMKPGDLYRRADVLKSQRNLYESNLFRFVHIVIPPQGDSGKIVEIAVREAPLRDLRTSLGFNTVDFIQAEARFTHYNWFGGGRRLDVQATAGDLLAPQLNGSFLFRNALAGLGSRAVTDAERVYLQPTWQASIDVTQPWFHSPDNTLGFGVFTHRRSAPLIFVDRGFGASASFTRNMAERMPVTLSYRFEETRVEAGSVYFCVNFGICQSNVISALQGDRRLSPLALSGFVDRTNDVFQPSSGYIGRLDLEHAASYTASDFHYYRASGQLSEYRAVGGRDGRKLVLASRVRAGYVRALAGTITVPGALDPTGSQIIHPRKRFYAGGSQSVRGFGENLLGPKVLTIDPNQLASVGCDPAAPQNCSAAQINQIASREFVPRPVGGTSLLEGSVELRIPITTKIGGAVFVDGAFVGSGSLADVAKGAGAITPGFGARYYSSAGAIRIDIGIRPSLVENLNVLSEVTRPDGVHEIVRLEGPKRYDPLEGASGFRQVLDRLTLHLSIGQAF